MKNRFFAPLAFVSAVAFCLCAPSASADDDAASILKQSGITGGLVVHLDCGDATLTAGLHPADCYMVHGLATSNADLQAARASLLDKNLYGPVSVELLEGTQLPYVDNLVNLLVVDETSAANAGIADDELMRVLCPNGVLMKKSKNGDWSRTVKPRPGEIDDWTHYFHSAEGNAVAKDSLVGPPDRLQWVGSPLWSRHHDRMASISALVSANGRLFYIIDEGSRISIQLPSKWTLIARDAFNGVILWKKPIDKWSDQMFPLKSGPSQLARRLVAIGDRVYTQLNVKDPLSCLDAATGEVLFTYDDQGAALEEILVKDDIVYALVNRGDWAIEDYAPQAGSAGDQARVKAEYEWNEEPRELHAIDALTGKRIWAKDSKVAPLSMVTDGQKLVYHDGDKLVCIETGSGEKIWENENASRRTLFEFNYGPRVVLHGDTVLYAGGDGKMIGADGKTGETLWEGDDPPSGYRSPQDLLVSGGLVWAAAMTSGKHDGVFTGRDPRTGEVKHEFPPTVDTYWFHHRCYLSKATEKYIMPSRTGIEFVDHEKQTWDINHWVRGGCLYGVMPANGFTYAPPHNCACYPEAKLSGFNALASSGSTPVLIPDNKRLERGPAYDADIDGAPASDDDWPTYRKDNRRSGFNSKALPKNLAQTWKTDLGGKLTPPTVAAGKLFVAQIDAHTVHAFDTDSGGKLWRYTAGGRVDSPPTYWNGRVLFGSADGNVYCLRASDGELAWRFRAAPATRRTMALEQLESLWPVPGSVLVENDVVSFVAGRSAFLDQGMKFFRLDAATGEKLVETVINDRDPETGGDLQDRIQTLQMPVGLNDILSSDGKFTYLRSQKIIANGTRVEIGPVSGSFAGQGGAQTGEGAHVFAPMGFRDGTWFHRAYWVYGRNFAGGHGGYHQAGKYAPSGRILVHDEENVYGYGREPQYLKWTTVLEHQLFSASREIPDVTPVDPPKGKGKGKGKRPAPTAGSAPVTFENSARLNPAGKTLTIEAWVMPDNNGNGVVLAHGGPKAGYALSLKGGIPQFHLRSKAKLTTVAGSKPIGDEWVHLAAVLDEDASMRLYVDGEPAAKGKAVGLIDIQPAQTLELGGEETGPVGDYPIGRSYAGLIDDIAVYHRALSADEIARRVAQPGTKPKDAVIACSFENAANDESGGKNHGSLAPNIEAGKGITGSALWVRAMPKKPGPAGKKAAPPKKGSKVPSSGTHVVFHWTNKLPLYARAMALAGETLVVAGPPDTIDEQETFDKLAAKDDSVRAQLKAQDAALDPEAPSILRTVTKSTGEEIQELELDTTPVWDGIAIANGRLYLTAADGSIQCFAVASASSR